MEQRITAYATLAEQVKNLEPQVPERLKDAWFQLIAYPVQCSAAMNEKILGAKLSYHYAAQGETANALTVSNKATEAYRTIRDLTYRYNNVLAGGKWNGMMSYSPNSLGFYYEPDLANLEAPANPPFPQETPTELTTIPAKDYRAKTETVKIIEELGIAGASLTVLPFNMTQYSASNITSAPSVEYSVPLKQGKNTITVKCLPTFPLYPGLDLRYAVSVDGAAPQFVSIMTVEGQSEWRSGVLSGYAGREIQVQSDTEKEANLKIYFADPGLVLSAIEVSFEPVSPQTALMVNPDFEYDRNGALLTGITRGDPYGWTHTGTLKGNSWGTNQDALNYHGGNVCWYASTPMPATFELSQTIKGLPAGEYLLRCRLGVPISTLTTQRLFANKYVQYYGRESDYISNLTSGEKNTFAGYRCDYESSTGTMLRLKEMAVKVIVQAGENLKIGIRSGNKLSDGTSATDNAGFFKVDHFRLELIRELDAQTLQTQLGDLIREAQQLYDSTREGTVAGEYPSAARTAFQAAIQAAQTVSQNTGATMTQLVTAVENLQKAISNYKKSVITFTAYIVNASFEYKAEGELNDGNTVRGDPYGWLRTGTLAGNSYGINNDATNMDGNNVCWYSSTPMPAAFELFQNISGLPAGEYTVRCKMSVPNDVLTTQRLFANSSVQYYGYQTNYGTNLVADEEYTFAGWPTSGTHNLQEMKVDVTLAEGEILKLGVRTSNRKANGSAATNNAGWFKVDHFRLEAKELHGGVGLDKIEEENLFLIRSQPGGFRLSMDTFARAYLRVISLSGQTLYSRTVKSAETWVPLPQGLYIVQLSAPGINKAAKIWVR
jgi:hypothetical protein